MSEYQYYEFQAIDRPLTADEMSELRSHSTRARITPTSFVNDYSWGGFKGDEDAWMERYFDAFLYVANWGTRVLKLRLPVRVLDPATARTYCGGGSACVWEASGKVIVSLELEDGGDGDWVEAEGLLSSVISVRAELARGDLRALYLGWLLRAQSGELADDDVEPSVPPGLGQLSASLQSLAELLQIDGDLVDVAAKASPPIDRAGTDRDEVRAWVKRLTIEDKDELITSLVADDDHARIAELRRRFLEEGSASQAVLATAGRTVGELLEAAEACAAERVRVEAEARAKRKAQHEREAAAARARHLDRLVGHEIELWAEVCALIATKRPRDYDRAVRLLVDLRDLAARGGAGDFSLRLEALRQDEARKPSFIARLGKAGL